MSQGIHEIVGGDLSSLKHVINELGKIGMIYVSIGSKYNEAYVNLPESKIRTNSICQLIPCFLNFEPVKLNHYKLIIAIDDFSNHESRIYNRKLLEKILVENMQVILFDKLCNKPFLEQFIELFISLCESNTIDTNNAMICNFVKHMNMPNAIEEKAEFMIPATIDKLLRSSNYSDCFYDWFGYKIHTYNFIYRYKKHVLYDLSNFKSLFADVIANKNTDILKNKQFIEFLENIHDITYVYRDYTL